MKDFSISVRRQCFRLLFILFSGSLLQVHTSALADDSVIIYTPYTRISVPPGESIEYTINVINKGDRVVTTGISVSGLSRAWDYRLQAGGWNIRELSVLPGEQKNLILQVEVPLRVNKGDYRFAVSAGSLGRLPLVINVSEQGTFKTEFTTDQANMEGHPEHGFTFSAELRNRTAEKQLYSLRSDAPPGWRVTFKPEYQQATSVEIEPNNSVDVTIEINPPNNIQAGTYKIPLQAVTKASSASLELEVVITGTYELELTTPTGLLSADITAGNEKSLELVVRNTGSSELSGINLSASAPANWEVIFDPQTIDMLGAGENAQVLATVKASDKAIPGDYVTNMNARAPEASSAAAFRISVKTPLLWGWVGVVIIIFALGSVYYLFRKYGRR